jgi:hypothetical protein
MQLLLDLKTRPRFCPVNRCLSMLEYYKLFDARLTKFKNNQILLNEMSHRYLQTTKLFTG